MSKVHEAVLKARKEQTLPHRVPLMLPLVEESTPIVSAQWTTPLKSTNGHGSNVAKAAVLTKVNGTNGHAPINGANGHTSKAVNHRLLKRDLDFAPSAPRKDLWKMVRGRFGTPDEHLVSLLTPSSFESEQYRKLRYSVEQLKQKKGVSIIAVSSPAPGDGKTMTALNLAGSLSAGTNNRVLVVEGDLRKPSIAKYLKMGFTSPGLAEFVSQSDRYGLIQIHPRYNLAVFPAGNSLRTPYEALKSARLGHFLEDVRSHFDYIIVDAPPLVPLSDCRLIQEHVDGILVVVRAGRDPRDLVDEAVQSLDPKKVLGIVFNGDQCSSRYYKSYKNGPAESRPTKRSHLCAASL